VSIDGIINVNKPKGKTSFQVVSLVQRLSGERRVGHAGTLDPQATGVLPVCLGQGTRVIQFLAQSRKVYLAEIELGLSTDTWDITGTVVQRQSPSSVTREKVEMALRSFLGVIEQLPPMYSALKLGGKRLYELARAGIEVEREPRKVQIFRLELIEWRFPCFTIEVECGKGTYIRSLAHELGQTLGCGACLKDLTRLKYGIFHIDQGVSLPQLEEAFHYGYWKSFLHSIDEVFLQAGAAIVGAEREQAIKQGRPISLGGEKSSGVADSPSGHRCRAYSTDGRFLALLKFRPDKELWYPEKVFPRAESGE
jgi:tRNA pseudouridine55 synthase